jgi:hypothetical protein
MHPMWGRKVGRRAAGPAYEATKTADRDVEIPGLTGLPIRPRKVTSIARWLSSASKPPTTYPFGHDN